MFYYDCAEAISSREAMTTIAARRVMRAAGRKAMDDYKRGSLAFEGPKTPDRGYTVRCTYLEPPMDGDALIEILKDGDVVREFTWPAYKIWNIAAHFRDIVDSELAGDDYGYRLAGWCGIGPV